MGERGRDRQGERGGWEGSERGERERSKVMEKSLRLNKGRSS